MDEYRPYPTDQPDDDQDENEDVDENDEQDDELEEDDQPQLEAQPSSRGEREERGERAERRERGDRGDRADRAEPNLDHPGGHLTGTVARLNRPRRFGFLRTEDGMEVFFHASALESGPSSFDQLRSGQGVEFDCHQDDGGRGLAATLVQVVGPPPPETPRQQRPSREERRGGRGERGERGERGGRDNWRVEVLTDRGDTSVRAQLERLLNERNVKPGNFTIALHEGQGGPECWVAYHTGDK